MTSCLGPGAVGVQVAPFSNVRWGTDALIRVNFVDANASVLARARVAVVHIDAAVRHPACRVNAIECVVVPQACKEPVEVAGRKLARVAHTLRHLVFDAVGEVRAPSAVPTPRAGPAAEVASQVGALGVLVAASVVDTALVKVDAVGRVVPRRAAPR